MAYYMVRGYNKVFFTLDDARKFAVNRTKSKIDEEIDMDTAGGYTTIGRVYSIGKNDFRWRRYGIGEWVINKNGKIIRRIL